MLGTLANRIPWLVLAAVSLSLFAAGLIGPRESTQAPAVVRVAQSEPPPPEVNPNRAEWRQEQDLRAQWDQVRWAQAAAIAGILGALAAAVGIIFIRGTLEATRKATEVAIRNSNIAQSQAAAAIEANAVNRQAYISDQRPWIRLEVEIGGPLTYELDEVFLGISCRMQNLGRSPAIQASPHIELISLEPARFPPHSLLQGAIDRAERSAFGVTIFPNDTKTMRIGARLNRKSFNRAKERGHLALVVSAVVVYGSSLDKSVHRTAIQAHVRREKQIISQSGSVTTKTYSEIPISDGNIPEHELRISESTLIPGRAD